MAKKRIFERERNRKKLVKKYLLSRVSLKKEFKHNTYLEDRLEIQDQLQILPRNSTLTRLCNRCNLSGRSRGYYRSFGLSRHFFRSFAQRGFLPGIQKSSW